MGKKNLLYTLLVILLLAALGGGLFLLRQQQILRSQAAPASTLSLNASNSTPQIDDTFTVNVDIDTASNNVIGTELYVLFDQSKLSVEDIVPGSFFPNPQTTPKSIDNTNGQVGFTVYISTGATPRQGTGTVATITFKALQSGAANISFKTPDTIVGGVGEGGVNVLIAANPTTVTVASVGGPTSTPTPTQAAGANTPTPTTAGGGGANTPTPTTAGGGGANTPTPTIAGGGGASTPTPTIIGSGAGSGSSASGSGTSLPNTATPTETAFGILAGVLLVLLSIFIKFRRLI